eukprot:TRINITY_DN1805_c0_g2_i1.p1 TRINITY_DN1805_c0_g2~~TRINITY_DN1805_c0_g2_i1.p1  ORF type:complete len:394 (-),score=47.37 TRINITY_DN1805_c0_g2_i1:22-1074(-)
MHQEIEKECGQDYLNHMKDLVTDKNLKHLVKVSRIPLDKSIYFNFQNPKLRSEFRRFLTKNNARIELVRIYDIFTIWENMENYSPKDLNDAIVKLGITQCSNSALSSRFSFSEIQDINEVVVFWRAKKLDSTGTVYWDHMFLVLFTEWVNFCDRSGIRNSEVCRYFRTTSTNLDAYVSFQTHLNEKFPFPILELYSRLLLISTYPKNLFLKKYSKLEEFLSKLSSAASLSSSENNISVLVNSILEFGTANTPQNCQVVANYIEKVLLNIHCEWKSTLKTTTVVPSDSASSEAESPFTSHTGHREVASPRPIASPTQDLRDKQASKKSGRFLTMVGRKKKRKDDTNDSQKG